MTATGDIWLDKPPSIELAPAFGYRALGTGVAMVFGLPSLLLAPIAPFFAIPGLLIAVALARAVRAERVWVAADGLHIRRQPMLRDEFVAWERIDEVALPQGALRSPWLRADGCNRIRLPLFVASDGFADAVALHRADVLDRTCEWIVHTKEPRGRWIEGVWVCDAHRKKWCGPCNAERTKSVG